MKKVIIAGILILAVCTAFLVGRQSTSRADISWVFSRAPYQVRFGQWVQLWLQVHIGGNTPDTYFLNVQEEFVEGGLRRDSKFVIKGAYYDNEFGRYWYNNGLPVILAQVEAMCKFWTAEGYPISLNDFKIDIEKIDIKKK